MKNRLFSSILLLSFKLIGCQTDNTAENSIGDNKGTILSVGLTKTRTVFGNQIDEIYPVYWSDGDRIVVNGLSSKAKDFHIALPMGETDACTIEMWDSNNLKITASWSAKKLERGIVYKFDNITYTAGGHFELPSFDIDFDIIDGFVAPIYGFVTTTHNAPLAGVVVSDGVQCVQTNENGFYQMDSDLSTVKFITASIPSGHKALNDENGMPQFYHRVTEQEVEQNSCVAKR